MIEMSALEVVVCLSEIIDLMCEEIRDHHQRVACTTYHLAKKMGIEKEALRDIVIAASLHDIGGLSMEARRCASLHFEDTNSHAERGYKLLTVFAPFQNIANIIRYHHVMWDHGNATDFDGNPLPVESQILLMADRIAVTLTPGIHTLNQAHDIRKNVLQQEGEIFYPKLVRAFQEISQIEAFWLDIMSRDYYNTIMQELKEFDIVLEKQYVEDMLNLLSNLVDFRSIFTTVHSKGVSAVAQELAHLMGFSEKECYNMKVAALMHDIGKLAIPTEIIEKPGPLSQLERDIIRTHSYYTDRVISRLNGFERVRTWASCHHENLDGTGYPFGMDEQSLNPGCKIIKVADVFVALTENRPYRSGMTGMEALKILRRMVADGEVEPKVVDVLENNLEPINTLRKHAEEKAAHQYEEFVL